MSPLAKNYMKKIRSTASGGGYSLSPEASDHRGILREVAADAIGKNHTGYPARGFPQKAEKREKGRSHFLQRHKLIWTANDFDFVPLTLK